MACPQTPKVRLNLPVEANLFSIELEFNDAVQGISHETRRSMKRGSLPHHSCELPDRSSRVDVPPHVWATPARTPELQPFFQVTLLTFFARLHSQPRTRDNTPGDLLRSQRGRCTVNEQTTRRQ